MVDPYIEWEKSELYSEELEGEIEKLARHVADLEAELLEVYRVLFEAESNQ